MEHPSLINILSFELLITISCPAKLLNNKFKTSKLI